MLFRKFFFVVNLFQALEIYSELCSWPYKELILLEAKDDLIKSCWSLPENISKQNISL